MLSESHSSSVKSSSTMSAHFPSSSDSISRARFTHARRVPSDRLSNRHMACVGEDVFDKVTFCSSVASTYTTVTFVPPARRVRHSDAADFSPSLSRVNRLAEQEEVKAAAGVEKKLKKSYSKILLKKVRSFMHNKTSKNPSKDTSEPLKPVASCVSGRLPRPNFTNPPSAPARSGTTSLHHYQRTIRPMPSVATIGPIRSCSSNPLESTHINAREARETRTRTVRRSRSFDDAECSSLAACIALDEAVRDLLAREMAERQQNGEANPETRSSGDGTEYVTDDEETLQNHDEPEDGTWILEELMDLLKMENDEITEFENAY